MISQRLRKPTPSTAVETLITIGCLTVAGFEPGLLGGKTGHGPPRTLDVFICPVKLPKGCGTVLNFACEHLKTW